MTRGFSRLPMVLAWGFALLTNPAFGDIKASSQTFDAKGVKLHFLVAGSGEPVVLIHGLASSADINWRLTGVFAELASDHRVIALDLPGHGRSDKPESEEAYGLRMVEDVVLLLDHLKIPKAHVVGYSLGGMIAAKLIATHPERVSSGLIGGMGWFRDGSGLQRFWAKVPMREGKRSNPALIHSIGKLALTREELKSIRVPVEVFVGQRDPLKAMYVSPLRPERPDWTVIEIDDAGHFDCLAKPEFKATIATWVRGNSIRPEGVSSGRIPLPRAISFSSGAEPPRTWETGRRRCFHGSYFSGSGRSDRRMPSVWILDPLL